MKIEVIAVPVDFSDSSRAALDYAIELAERFEANLHLIHAYPADVPATAYYGGPVLPPDFTGALREAAAGKLEQWSAEASARGARVTQSLSRLPPSEAVSEIAEEIGADLIVMGTRGLSGLQHVLLGSVAERTLRNATCPVLTVKHSP